MAEPEYDLIVPTGTYYPTCKTGASGTVCLSDNSFATFYITKSGPRGLESADRKVVRRVMNQQFGTTRLDVKRHTVLIATGQAETDIVSEEHRAGIPAGADGIAYCDDAVDRTPFRCDQQYVRIRGRGYYTPGLTCHEAGHAFGMVHPTLAYPVIVGGNTSKLGCAKKTVPVSATLSALERENLNYVY